MLPFAKLWQRRKQWRCGGDLPFSLIAGPGFKLLHVWGCVINREAQIGANVTIMQGATLSGMGTGIPTNEDDLIVFANATVIGRVRLGRGAVVVGASAVVLRDIPAGCRAVGNPARILQRIAPAKKCYHPLPARLR